MLSLEDSEEYAHLLSKYELLQGGARNPDEIIAMIDAVSVEDIKRVADDIIKESKMKCAVIGPYKEEKHFEDLMKF